MCRFRRPFSVLFSPARTPLGLRPLGLALLHLPHPTARLSPRRLAWWREFAFTEITITTEAIEPITKT